MLEAVFGLDHGDTHEEKFAKLVRYLETWHPAKARDAAPLLASLLSLPVAAPYRVPELTPQQQKEGIIDMLLDLLLAASAQHPVLLAVEDLHWVDPSTLEFISRFLALKRKAAILTVLTARPEFDPPWPGAVDWQQRLSPLSRTDAKKMVAAINRRLPPEMVAQIVERSDGVPLFIEEMTKAASADDHATVPATLNDLLAARLETTGKAKAVAQLAATIGREFDEELLRKVALLDAGLLARALGRLEDAGLVLPLSQTRRQFKHALIQEAAYQSQTKADRQSAHRRIAQALQDDFPDVAANSPEVLAQHWSAAGDVARAVHFWQLAGRHAVDRFAYKEALSHFAACERQLAMLPPSKERDRQEFNLLTSWSRAEQMATGFGAESSMERLRRATVLLEQGIGDARDVFQLQWGRWETAWANVGHHEGVKIAELLMDIAERENDRPLLLQAHHALGVSLFWTGEMGKAREHLEQSIALEDQDIEALTRSAYGHVMVIAANSYLSWALWLLGETERAFVVSQDTLALAQHADSTSTLAYALTFAATLQRWEGNVEETLRLAEEGRKAAIDSNNLVFDHVLAVTSAWAAVRLGDAAAIAPVRKSIDVIRQVYGAATISLLALFADTLLHLGKAEEALQVVEEALQLAKEKHDFHLLAELQRLQGMCFQMRGDSATARQCFQTAIAVSSAQGSVALERKARASLAAWQKESPLRRGVVGSLNAAQAAHNDHRADQGE
ncbi:MAG TPA: tetratricopeptide repeat protein [Rhodocyclaceae bacterium]|nr:tetratricopeptide repeat protein [Rhodocyclaceae bacterium]